MKFVILDVYPNKKHRLIKDTAGGYGTGNDFGNTIFSKILNLYVDNNIGMPAIEIMIISSILKKNHEVHYTRNPNDKEIIDSDFIILPSSIKFIPVFKLPSMSLILISKPSRYGSFKA